MSRWAWCALCAVLGLVLCAAGLLVPAHLRAVDARVIELAGRNSPGLVERGQALASVSKLGAAQLLQRAAEDADLADREKFGLAVHKLSEQHPEWRVSGGVEPRLAPLFAGEVASTNNTKEAVPFTEYVIRLENRERVLEWLKDSPNPAVQELVRTRTLTNTTVFPPSQSSSGQAFDAAVSICGLLVSEGRLTTGLSNSVASVAAAANHGSSSEPLEMVLMDFMSLGQRLNWGQLVDFVGRIEDTGTLQQLAGQVRKSEDKLAMLFSAVELSGKPAGVAGYLMNFNQSGLKDLGLAVRSGMGGVNELLERNLQVHRSGFGTALALDYCWRMPFFALSLKWLLYLAGGFLLAAAMHFMWPPVTELERPLQVRGFHVAREFLFALGFLLVVVLLSEPFLAQESQKMQMPFRLRLPTVGAAAPAGSNSGLKSIMNLDPKSLMIVGLFFIVQGLIYVACLVKLAEIRRQRVEPRVKLRLLENEEHLFDAGLYLGFAGTVVSLILASLSITKSFSLLSAYSSTAFGIVFVSTFKIFHLRPARRTLLLEAETTRPEPAAPAGARLATAP